VALESLACKLFERIRRDSAAIRIQKHARKFQARQKYSKLRLSVVAIQTSLRSMAAHKEFRFRRRTKAAIAIEVHSCDTVLSGLGFFHQCRSSLEVKLLTPAFNVVQSRWRCHRTSSYYKKLKKASIVTQCRWRGRMARRELRKLKMVSSACHCCSFHIFLLLPLRNIPGICLEVYLSNAYVKNYEGWD